MEFPLTKTSGIYKILNTVNEKFYIGSTKQLRGRSQEHYRVLVRGNHSNPKLQSFWNKYGENSFVFQIIEEVGIPNLVEREQFHIDTLKPVLNIRTVAHSNQGLKASEETKAKIGAKSRGRITSEATKEKQRAWIKENRQPISEETRRRYREAWLGKIISVETRKKISEANKGKKRSEESKQKMINYATGRRPSEETRKKMSESGKNRAPPSKETREKLSRALKGRFVSEETNEKKRISMIKNHQLKLQLENSKNDNNNS